MSEPSHIGITTTVPIEIIMAAGKTPVDLNNIFVGDPDANGLVSEAELNGFPQTTCAWIKGLYGVIHARDIKEIIGVVEGDCSDTGCLLEILESEGRKVYPFGFPHSRAPEDLTRQMERLAAALGTNLEKAESFKKTLDEVRKVGGEIDGLAKHGAITSRELFDSLLLLSDFGGDVDATKKKLSDFLADARTRPEEKQAIRLACVGVPTILSDLWEVVERFGARVVFHEVPRQFAMVDGIGKNLTETYLNFTYPYTMAARLDDIECEADDRKIDGVLHYVQSFCHRQIHDRLLRERLSLPILTLEADRPGKVDARSITRIEAFCEQLS